MKFSGLALVIALGLTATAAFAADVDGKWTGALEMGNGPIPLNYTFNSHGAELTGTYQDQDGKAIPLKTGKIDGNKLSFAVDLDFGQGPTTFQYTGVIANGEIKVHSEFMGMPIDFTLKKTP